MLSAAEDSGSLRFIALVWRLKADKHLHWGDDKKDFLLEGVEPNKILKV